VAKKNKEGENRCNKNKKKKKGQSECLCKTNVGRALSLRKGATDNQKKEGKCQVESELEGRRSIGNLKRLGQMIYNTGAATFM